MIRTIGPLAVAAAVGASLSIAGTAAAHPNDDIVIQFTTGGGITGTCCEFWDLPEITVYADGRAVIVEPGEGQVPEMTQATLSRTDVLNLFEEADRVGLFDVETPATGALCCDLAYTQVVLADDVDGFGHADFQVTGLGFEGQTNDELTAEQLAMRGALIDVQDQLRALVAEDGDAADYTPHAVALLVAPPRDESVGHPQQWPLDEPLAEGLLVGPGEARCVAVTGTDVQVVLDAVGSAESAEWTSNGAAWTVFVRPLLPDENRCPEGDEWAPERTELSERRTQWILSGVFDDYRFVISAQCFCPTDYTTPRTVTVEGGAVAAVEPELPANIEMPLTVDDLFDLVERGLDDGDVVDVRYDDEFGFPVTIFIDWDSRIMDDESAYEVSAFEPIT